MSKIISCILPNATKAEEAVERLRSAGFASSEVSVLLESKLREGHALVSVHTDDEQHLEWAKEIFRDCGGEEMVESKELAA